MTSFVQQDLFAGPDSSVSTFRIYPNEARKDGYLRDFIEATGGILLDPDEDDCCAITLVDIDWVKSTEYSVNLPTTQVQDYFHSQFIYDCYREQQLHDLNNYLIGQSVFGEYDANDVLLRREGWSDLKRKKVRRNGNGDLFKNASSSRDRPGDQRPDDSNNPIITNKGKNRSRQIAKRACKMTATNIQDNAEGEPGVPLVEFSSFQVVPDENEIVAETVEQDSQSLELDENEVVAEQDLRSPEEDENEAVSEQDSRSMEADKRIEESSAAVKPKKKHKRHNFTSGSELEKTYEDGANEQKQNVEAPDCPNIMTRKSKKRKNDAALDRDDLNDDNTAADTGKKLRKEKQSFSRGPGFEGPAFTDEPFDVPQKKKKKKKSIFEEIEAIEILEGNVADGEGLVGQNADDTYTNEDLLRDDASNIATEELNKKRRKKKKKKTHNYTSENQLDSMDDIPTEPASISGNGVNHIDSDEVEKSERFQETPKKKKKGKNKKIADAILEPEPTTKRQKRLTRAASPEIIILSEGEQVQNGIQEDPVVSKHRVTRSTDSCSITSNQSAGAKTKTRKHAENDKEMLENGTKRERVRRSNTCLGKSDFNEDSELVIATASTASCKRKNFVLSDSDDDDDSDGNFFVRGPKVLEAVSKYREPPQNTPTKKTSKRSHVKIYHSDSDSDTQVTRAANTPAKKGSKAAKVKKSSTKSGLVESSTLPETEISPNRRSKGCSIIYTQVKRFNFDDSSSSSSENGDSDYFPS